MILKSLHIQIPDSKPFDRSDWFESFVGHFVLPIVETGQLSSFWFTRYADDKIPKHARFRFRINDYSSIEKIVNKLITDWGLIDLADEQDYQMNELRERRFLGDNKRQSSAHARQELIWDFLHASSRLYLDTFSHSDADKYWHREENHDRGNNLDGETLESVHHLFCNMTNVSPRVELLAGNNQGVVQLKLLAAHYRRWSGIPDSSVLTSQRVDF